MNYKEYMSLNLDNKFKYFMDTRFPTNRTPEYWVNWDKVYANANKYEIMLNTMNYLVGKQDIRVKTQLLFNQQPELIAAIPILLACRDKAINVLSQSDDFKLNYYQLDFKHPSDDIDKYIEFMDESGILTFLKSHVTKSLVDYVFGVEVGLDSNGRKNRGGTENENILEKNLQLVVNHNPECEYLTQATANAIKDKWGIDVPEALDSKRKGGRRYDGALYNHRNKSVIIIETNFYGGGGSKLKSVAGEFSEIYGQYLRSADDINFIWISDGPGWDSAKNPMREAFDVIPNIINLNMVNEGYISDILNS